MDNEEDELPSLLAQLEILTVARALLLRYGGLNEEYSKAL